MRLMLVHVCRTQVSRTLEVWWCLGLQFESKHVSPAAMTTYLTGASEISFRLLRCAN